MRRVFVNENNFKAFSMKNAQKKIVVTLNFRGKMRSKATAAAACLSATPNAMEFRDDSFSLI